MDSIVCLVNTYPLESDFFSGWFYPPFEQLGPGALLETCSCAPSFNSDLVLIT